MCVRLPAAESAGSDLVGRGLTFVAGTHALPGTHARTSTRARAHTHTQLPDRQATRAAAQGHRRRSSPPARSSACPLLRLPAPHPPSRPSAGPLLRRPAPPLARSLSAELLLLRLPAPSPTRPSAGPLLRLEPPRVGRVGLGQRRAEAGRMNPWIELARGWIFE